jgi:hypothetical protein
MKDKKLVKTALKLDANSIYVIEIGNTLSTTYQRNLERYLDKKVKGKNIQFIILHGGLKIVKSTEAVDKFVLPNFTALNEKIP